MKSRNWADAAAAMRLAGIQGARASLTLARTELRRCALAFAEAHGEEQDTTMEIIALERAAIEMTEAVAELRRREA